MSTIWTKTVGLAPPSKFLTALILMVGFETTWANFSRSQPLSAPPQTVLNGVHDVSCMRATNYYLPSADDYTCKNKHKIAIRLDKKTQVKICPAAHRAARMQGSIQITHNGQKYLYRADRSTEPTPRGCATTTGADNICLIPYIHIAADPRFHNMGDVIEIPELKGALVPHPSGFGTMPHPGYLIVADTGGRIKQHNRFDFFIGQRSWRSKDNPFGPHGLGMTDERKCIMSFRKLDGKSSLAQQIKTTIRGLVDTNPSTIAQARNQASSGGH